MKCVSAMAAMVAAAACAGQLTLVTEPALPRDPSGFPVYTNSLPDQVALLTMRVCRLEAAAASNELRRAAMAERRAKASEAAAKARAESEAGAKWLRDAMAKYGRMTLVGYDPETRERSYRRADGVVMKVTWALDTPVAKRKGGRR